MKWLSSCCARVAVYAILLGVASTVYVAGAVRSLTLGGRRSRRNSDRRLILLGTFYNLGWFRSHILPLAHCDALDEIIVICDEPLLAAPKVTYWHPPRWLRWMGRTPARFLWALRVARLRRPGYWMGYHIMPNSLFALVGARLFGARAIYQMTGGPIQLIGGGVGSENVLLRRLRKSSRWMEALLFHVVRRFDGVIVRGGRAKAFVAQHRLSTRCEIITGSVDVDRFCPDSSEPMYDVVYVSRLVSCKGLEDFLRIVESVAKDRPSIRVAVVGGGPLRETLSKQVQTLGVDGCVEFLGQVDRVEEILKRSRVFVLVSPSEGLSIAMLEAMAAGLPAVVNDVGDLGDMVEVDRTGLLLEGPEPVAAARAILRVLEDDALRAKMSDAARRAVMDRCSVEAVARRWTEILGGHDRDGAPEHSRAASRTTAPALSRTS